MGIVIPRTKSPRLKQDEVPINGAVKNGSRTNTPGQTPTTQKIWNMRNKMRKNKLFIGKQYD